MHVVSKVVFYLDRDKVVCHLYNTTQRIMVNGRGYEKLTDMFLKPLFQSKVDFYGKEIKMLNEEVSKKFGPKFVKRSDVKFKEGASYPCFRCDLIFKSLPALNKHKISDHGLSFNTSKSQLEPRESTRNNSLLEYQDNGLTEKLLNEDISLDESLIENGKMITKEKMTLKFLQTKKRKLNM